jgi:hypothetical protein
MNTAYLAQDLWNQLWNQYRQRVPYAQIYEAMIRSAGGIVANDHIAFRSLRLQVEGSEESVNLGIAYLAEIVEWLGYQVAGEYQFPDRHLYARHYCHPQQDALDLPKLFISELIVDELPPSISQMIRTTVQSGQFFSLSAWQQICPAPGLSDQDRPDLARSLITAFQRPWPPPRRQIVEAVNGVSQYGAWVLLHGYAVNHFTAYINRQNTPAYPDITATAQALARGGVPMKDSIEGNKASGLQQTSTQAIVEPVEVLNEQGELEQMDWSYAYYELAERHQIADSTGHPTLFNGFIGAQAQQLFEMTRV